MSQAHEQGSSTAGEMGPGLMLAALRNERKLSVTDVAQRLKYGVRQIEALEAEEFGRLPGTTFVRGMIRGYAKLLAVDPEPLLKALEQRYVPGEVTVDLRAKGTPFLEGSKRGTGLYLSLSLLMLVAIGGVLYEWHSGGAVWTRIVAGSSAALQIEHKPPPATPPPAPQAVSEAPVVASAAPAAPALPAAAPPPSTAPSPEPRSEGRIRLEVDSESWVEIRDKDGKALISQLVPAGTRRTLVGYPPLSVVIGNAAAARLTYNDNPVDLKPYVKIEVARLTLD